MFKYCMENKGFTDISADVETPNDISYAEKPLKKRNIKSGRVDINVLKSKLQETENKEFRKNIFIFSTLVFTLGAIGIYFSL